MCLTGLLYIIDTDDRTHIFYHKKRYGRIKGNVKTQSLQTSQRKKGRRYKESRLYNAT